MMKTKINDLSIPFVLFCCAIFMAFTDTTHHTATAVSPKASLCNLARSADTTVNYIASLADLATIDSICIDGPAKIRRFNVVLLPVKRDYAEIINLSDNKLPDFVKTKFSKMKAGDMVVLSGITVYDRVSKTEKASAAISIRVQ